MTFDVKEAMDQQAARFGAQLDAFRDRAEAEEAYKLNPNEDNRQAMDYAHAVYEHACRMV